MQRTLRYITLFAAFALTACADFSNIAKVEAFKPKPPEEIAEYRIAPGDVVDIKFFYTRDLNETVTVRPDGRISLQLVDDVLASGLTPSELDEKLTKLYRPKLTDTPDISVIVKEFEDQRIYVTGEVDKPGELKLRNKMTAFQAVTAAGGLKNTAAKDTVLVIRQKEDGISQVFKANFSDGNLTEGSEGSAHAHLQPRDTVYVPKSGIATANLFVDQYIHQMLMFNGVNVGVTGIYELNDVNSQ
jgi:polysaccharide biosynthesis/export protein